MFTWIKTNLMAIMGWTIAGLFSALMLMTMLWQNANHDAETYRKLSEDQAQVVRAANRITEREHNLDALLRRANARVMESPNAHVLVPPDLASAWIDGIDSVRHDGKSPTGQPPHDMPRSGSPDAGKERADDSRANHDITKSRDGISSLQ